MHVMLQFLYIYTVPPPFLSTALWGMCQHSKGQYHLAKGEWGRAIHCLSEALKLSEDVFGPTHSQVRYSIGHAYTAHTLTVM